MTQKIQTFEEDLQHIAEIAKVLSHPARLAILRYLAAQESCISGNIAEELPLSRTTVSQHLQELKKLGLVKGNIEGTRVNYCIDQQKLREAIDQLEKFFQGIVRPQHPDCDC